MKRNTLATAGLALAAALVLSACGGDDSSTDETETTDSATETTDGAGGDGDVTTIVIGASAVPHAQILEFVQENLAADAGLELDIRVFDDYVLPNTTLAEGELDANYFQHLPYFEAQVESQGFEFSHFEGVHIEPFALYSEELTSLEELPDGATIGITSDPSNQGRALKLLEEGGLIGLADGVDAQSALLSDIADNPRNLEFVEAEPAALVRTLQDVDAAIINGNFALEAGLNPATDSLLLESGENNPYANFVAYHTEDEGDEALLALNELLFSDEVRQFIEETWPSGEVLPAF